MKHRRDKTIRSFFLGALVGAGLALLVAPSSGREMRSHLRNGIADASHAVRGLGQRIVERGREVLDDGSRLLHRGGRDVGDLEPRAGARKATPFPRQRSLKA